MWLKEDNVQCPQLEDALCSAWFRGLAFYGSNFTSSHVTAFPTQPKPFSFSFLFFNNDHLITSHKKSPNMSINMSYRPSSIVILLVSLEIGTFSSSSYSSLASNEFKLISMSHYNSSKCLTNTILMQSLHSLQLIKTWFQRVYQRQSGVFCLTYYYVHLQGIN